MYDWHISEVSEQNYNHDITLDFIDINDFFFSFLCFVALVHFELFFLIIIIIICWQAKKYIILPSGRIFLFFFFLVHFDDILSFSPPFDPEFILINFYLTCCFWMFG